MRKNSLSILALFGLAAACSSNPTVLSPRGDDPAPTTSSGATASSSAPATARALSLTGDGHALRLDGAPAAPSYVASYPVSGLTAMTVSASSFGDLTADCAGASGAVACPSLPFFTQIDAKSVQVFDAYGHVVLASPLTPGDDAGAPSLPPLPPVSGADAGLDDAGAVTVSLDGGSCAPSVTASLSGCSITIDGTTCACCDVSCASAAIEACLGVPAGAGGLSFDDAGFGALPDAAGLPGIGALDDAGGTSAACSASAVAAAQTQFCSDVDASLAADGSSATLDCAALSTLSFPSTLPSPSATAPTCDAVTHDAFAKVRAELATCNPLDYLGWSSAAQLQLFDDGACTVW